MLAVDGPVANGTAPDFLAELPSGEKLYVEATLATGVTPDVIGAEKRMAEVIDAINDVESPDFFWDVNYRGAPSEPVRRNDLKATLRTWAATLNYEEIAALNSRDRLPALLHDEHGLSLRIRPRPRQRTRGQPSKSLGVVMPEAYWGNSREPVRIRALGKANKYGELDHPLVVAVNTFAGLVGWSELAEVLFGDIAALVNPETGEARETRLSNGIWWNGEGWLNPKLDGLVVFSDLTPWTLAQRSAVKVIHPYKHPNGLALPLPGTELVLRGDALETIPGEAVRQPLALHARWPESAD